MRAVKGEAMFSFVVEELNEIVDSTGFLQLFDMFRALLVLA